MKNYAFVDTPLPSLILVLIYLSWVMVIGPFYMRDKKPFNLKSTLIYYNAFQVLLSGYMFVEVPSADYYYLTLSRRIYQLNVLITFCLSLTSCSI